jgi:hypothetical protein
MSSTRNRVAIFVAVVLVCAAIGIGYLVHAQSENPKNGKSRQPTTDSALQLRTYMQQPHVLFRNTDLGAAYGMASVTPLTNPAGTRAATSLDCDRVAMTNGVGVCMHTNQGIVTTYEAKIFDSSFHVTHTVALPGLPSRARVSPNGRWVAMTTFVRGDSYAGTNFSTRTQFFDTTTGKFAVANLENFKVTHNGSPVTAPSRNYWGVTWASDSIHFYATLDVNYTDIHLIEGDLTTHTARTMEPDIECPSLSPDQTRIAYKKQVDRGAFSAVKWRLHVLDLATGHDVALAETRSVDDQVEWLDNGTILYAIPRSESGSVAYDTYEVPADGTGTPRIFIRGAQSPAVATGAT